jgi:bifunctional UDP-N-acetylglucosamine pyrophosphorylase/glucosamine-1-phosphate N-acetyltransferase
MAAGEGTRMKSSLPKVLHGICGMTMIERVLSVCPEGETPCVVVGHGRDEVIAHVGDRARFFVQEQQHGTGHAVMMAKQALIGHKGMTLVLAADMPLLTRSTVQALIEAATGKAAALLSAIVEDPTGYGRILRDDDGSVIGIVEQKDATAAQRAIREINASVYCFDTQKLLSCLDRLGCDNAQNQYYLTDCIGMLAKANEPIAALIASEDECMGVNDRVQLAYAQGVQRKRINAAHMKNGVTIIDPAQTYIDEQVAIGRDTVIEAGAVLLGETKIGEGCHITGNTRMTNAVVGDRVTVMHSVLADCIVGCDVEIGPFANLRPKTNIGDGCRIGDFMELKNATIGAGTKMAHLSYIGDAVMGKDCNVGCGVTFANYDGMGKFQTIVGDNVFLGCNVNLVAPVEVEDGAYIAAGTTVTKRVSADALCIGRVSQTEKPGWAKDRREQGRLK